MTSGQLACVLVAFACGTSAQACSPPPVTLQAGFVRHDVGHLPANAKGVMFLREDRSLRPGDFKLTAGADPSPLQLRINAVQDQGRVRLEPVEGFHPGMVYHFAYLPKHVRWRFPDQMDVVIDAAHVDLAGDYVIQRREGPYQRVIAVPGGPACVGAEPAIVQDFSYRIPPSLAAYKKALDYRADVRDEAGSPLKLRLDMIDWETVGPRLYNEDLARLDQHFEGDYAVVDNAVVARCGTPRTRVVLRGWIGFPEVEHRYAKTAAITFGLDGASPSRCGRLPALLQTMRRKGALWTLRTICRFDPVTGAEADVPYGPASPEEKLKSWEHHLWRLQEMNEFCALAGLGFAWREGYLDTRPRTMTRLGIVIAKALDLAEPPEKHEIAFWLAYTVSQLPPVARKKAAQEFLASIQPALARLLAMPELREPELTAHLIAGGGKPAPNVVDTLRGVAVRGDAAGRLARSLLATFR